MPSCITCRDTTFGFQLAADTATQHIYISDFEPKSSAEALCSTPRATCKKFLCAFITAIQDTPVFTISDVKSEFCCLCSSTPPVDKIVLTLAPKALPSSCERTAIHKEMDLHDPHHLNTSDSDDELFLTTKHIHSIHALHMYTPLNCDDISDADINLLISTLQSEKITVEECTIGNFTHCKLKSLATWPQWHAAERTQLDRFDVLGMFGKPCYPPSGTITLSPRWQY
jgi:hypothetical protein